MLESASLSEQILWGQREVFGISLLVTTSYDCLGCYAYKIAGWGETICPQFLIPSRWLHLRYQMKKILSTIGVTRWS